MTPEEISKIVYERRFNSSEVAELLQISLSSLQRLRNSGAIKFSRIGGKTVFTESQVAEFLMSTHRQSPAQRRHRRPRSVA